jgi:hypothetical protein
VSPIEVVLHTRPADGEPPTDEQLVAAGERSYRSADGGTLVPGDHQLFVTASGKALAQRKIRLVSSDTPRLPKSPLGYRISDAAPWAALSADNEAPRAVRGALWQRLPGGPPPGSRPPTTLTPPISDSSDDDDDRLSLSYTQDVRPEQYTRRKKRRPTSIKQIVGFESVFTTYETQFHDAVAETNDEVRTPDGRKWRLKYHDNDEVSVSPVNGFVPMTRYAVTYDDDS